MSNSVFIVLECMDYEGSTPLFCFSNKSAAEKCAEECTEYIETRPLCPDMDAPDSEWDAYTIKTGAWRNNHPGGSDGWHGDSYDLCEIPFYNGTPE